MLVPAGIVTKMGRKGFGQANRRGPLGTQIGGRRAGGRGRRETPRAYEAPWRLAKRGRLRGLRYHGYRSVAAQNH
jgi:hypothetical protein